MRLPHRFVFQAVSASVVLAASSVASAQPVSANYELTVPAILSAPEFTPELSLVEMGPLRLAGARSSDGGGLSLEAGRSWFARVGVGRSLASDVVSVGGGYRFRTGDALS